MHFCLLHAGHPGTYSHFLHTITGLPCVASLICLFLPWPVLWLVSLCPSQSNVEHLQRPQIGVLLEQKKIAAPMKSSGVISRTDGRWRSFSTHLRTWEHISMKARSRDPPEGVPLWPMRLGVIGTTPSKRVQRPSWYWQGIFDAVTWRCMWSRRPWPYLLHSVGGDFCCQSLGETELTCIYELAQYGTNAYMAGVIVIYSWANPCTKAVKKVFSKRLSMIRQCPKNVCILSREVLPKA